MLHVGVLAGHPRWSRFLENLRWLVLDEVHTYSGVFGSNLAHVVRRFARICAHYGSDPKVVACSATIANPLELTETLVGRPFALVDDDGSPRGERTTVFWNPPKVTDSPWRSRRSANVEAQDIAVVLLRAGLSTIVFSKAKMTAEMIRRYVCETLEGEGLGSLAARVAAYRGGYTPEERRDIERRLFSGELVGVSTTPALELGVDVGSLAACVVVGYPGTISSFQQQAGRAGRRGDALVVLVGLDTAVNQYVMTHPDYVLEQPVEQAVVEPENPFVLMEHLRCAAHELPIGTGELERYGPWARTALGVLESERRVRHIRDAWWHSSPEVPQYEVSLRGFCDKNVIIEDASTHEAIGEMTKFDAQPILHPGAIYMHQGETYLILSLDLERNLATARKVDVDYYTQPLGGTDVHHIDHRIRERPLGRGTACWGEVTTYFRNHAFEKIRFYTLEAFAQEPLDLPTWVLETMAFWIIPPDDLLEEVMRAGRDVHGGLRGIGYATRMLLPMFLTCQTPDFSHTVGAANAPPRTVFIYERFPLGLGLTQRAYEILGRIMPRVLEHIRACPCADGCPLCVGKPLRGFTTWNVERGEASIPSKSAATLILEGLLEGECPDEDAERTVAPFADEALLEGVLRRRLARAREPWVLHDITPESELTTGLPPAGEGRADRRGNEPLRGGRPS
jgi:DEAD/DEAH box helicase domain-containing protein